MNSNTKNVICAKWGDYYNAEYVNKLYGMVSRNITPPFRFICLTNDPTDIRDEVDVIPLTDKSLIGWWCKIEFFKSPLHDITGTVLTLDLDLLIVDNIDKLFTYREGSFCMIKDLGMVGNFDYGNNSSVMRLNAGEFGDVYDDLKLNEIDHAIHNTDGRFKEHEYWGDQYWITEKMEGNTVLWPEHWIQTYVHNCHHKTSANIDDCEFFIPKDCKIISLMGNGFKNHEQLHKIKDIWQA